MLILQSSLSKEVHLVLAVGNRLRNSTTSVKATLQYRDLPSHPDGGKSRHTIFACLNIVNVRLKSSLLDNVSHDEKCENLRNSHVILFSCY